MLAREHDRTSWLRIRNRQGIDSKMPRLPECDYREQTDRRGGYYCLHIRVHAPQNLVTISVCRSCRMCAIPCANPRPCPGDAVAPQPPSLARQAWNLMTSVGAFIADGLQTVDWDEYERRLTICDGCDERRGNRCLKCGCRLSLKARGRAFRCPLDKWPEVSPTK